MSSWGSSYSDEEDEEEEEETYCDKCERGFGSGTALSDHLRNSSRHNWCHECDRNFATPAALSGHQVRHLPRVHPCPRRDCGAKFATMSALAKHMEMSSCFGRPSAATLVNKVRDWEAKSGNPNLLTTRRIEWHHSGDTSSASSSTYLANEGAWNGHAYECYFCDKECKTLGSLNQHLNSGVHEAKDFCCKHCGFTATWVSALIEHVESGKCGFMTRDQVHQFAWKPLAQLTLGR